jgi:hypothetical protein
MITLTTPPEINSILGGSAPVAYNKLVIGPFTLNPVTLSNGVTGIVRLTSTGSPTMQPINGTLSIDASTGVLTIEVGQLDFYRKVQLSGAQLTSVQNIIANAQNSLEAGLVSLGVIAGTQSTGA